MGVRDDESSSRVIFWCLWPKKAGRGKRRKGEKREEERGDELKERKREDKRKRKKTAKRLNFCLAY